MSQNGSNFYIYIIGGVMHELFEEGGNTYRGTCHICEASKDIRGHTEEG